jgi:hypothetical protein
MHSWYFRNNIFSLPGKILEYAPVIWPVISYTNDNKLFTLNYYHMVFIKKRGISAPLKFVVVIVAKPVR